MDDSVLVRFAKLCCQNGEGNLTRIWAFLHLTASRRKIVTRHWLSLERPEPRKTLYFLPAVWRSRAHLRSAVQGVPRSRFEARGGIERRDDDVRDR